MTAAKEHIDFAVVRAMLKKQWREFRNGLGRGAYSLRGNLLRILFVGAMLVVFIVFFGTFATEYAQVPTGGALHPETRIHELLTVALEAILVFMAIGDVQALCRELIADAELRVLSAMPIGTKTLYVAKLLQIWLKSTLRFLPIVLALAVTLGVAVPQPPLFWVSIVPVWLLLPLVSIALASLFAVPYFAVKQALRTRPLANFLVVTVLLGCGFALYALILNAGKELLLGDEFRYFFDEALMNKVAVAVRWCVPSRWIADVMLGRNVLFAALALLAVLAVALCVSTLLIRLMLTRSLKAHLSNTPTSRKRAPKLGAKRTVFAALLEKEFVEVFRTPSYMFSYFSVALIVPLMVYFCQTIGASLVARLAGIECNLEVALFLTLLFCSLSNAFCTTNVSRDGAMFYNIKAMPISHRSYFWAKVVFCFIVTAVSAVLTALLLALTGKLQWFEAAFVFAAALLFGIAYLCVATRSDFNHPHFSAEQSETGEAGGTRAVVIVFGLLVSLLVGGVLLAVRILTLLRGAELAWITYAAGAGATALCALLGVWYFARGLKRAYNGFERGDV